MDRDNAAERGVSQIVIPAKSGKSRVPGPSLTLDAPFYKHGEGKAAQGFRCNLPVKGSGQPPPSALAHRAAIFRRRALHPAPEIVGEAVVHIDVVPGRGIGLMQDDVRPAEARLGAMAGLEGAGME